MGEPDIQAARINRLIQRPRLLLSGTAPLNKLLILVANDEVAGIKYVRVLMDIAWLPSGVATRYFTLQKTIDVIHKISASQHIFLVAESEDVHSHFLVKGGVLSKR